MSDSISKRRLKLWIRLLRVTRAAEADLREFLRTEHASTLPRFDVLAALHRSDRAMTMSELSRQLLVSNGNTTTVVDRLEADGLVTRTPLATDRRIVHAELTDAGRMHFEQLAAEHEVRVAELFADVSEADLDTLEALMPRLTPPAARRHDEP